MTYKNLFSVEFYGPDDSKMIAVLELPSPPAVGQRVHIGGYYVVESVSWFMDLNAKNPCEHTIQVYLKWHR